MDSNLSNVFPEIKVELQEWMGSDRSIAEAAWTSSFDFQKKQERTEDDVKRVVNMLADMKHSVPFESVVFRFWIKMPISTDRQHMTHRIASHSGMSGRYRTMPNEWQHVPQDVVNIVQKAEGPIPEGYSSWMIGGYEDICERANQYYQSIVEELKKAQSKNVITNADMKRAREFLRNALPQGNMTERVTVMNLRSFGNYQKLRNSEHAQPEIHYLAERMLKEVVKHNVCPIALEALERNNWVI